MDRKILIVDDNDDLRNSLARVLAPYFRVLTAADGEEALALLRAERPQLTLLDVSMPGLSGLEVLAAAKRADPALIVIMLTSRHDIELAAAALDLGAVEFVTKPFDADCIRAAISRLLDPAPPPEGRPWRVAP